MQVLLVCPSGNFYEDQAGAVPIPLTSIAPKRQETVVPSSERGITTTSISRNSLPERLERNGPTATGQHCPEGWSLYPLPGPNYQGAVDSGSADSAYYDFVDRFDMLGLGKDIPLATGNESEGLLALVDGKFIVLRVPYPMGFYAKGLDGRIDDPNGGWKARGLWSTYGTRTPFHAEGGKDTTSKVVHFQLRPTPLAR